jgi:hypothetical protein
MTATKEIGVVTSQSGMGGFLNPPTHPEHSMHVETHYRNHRVSGGMSLSAAVKCEYLADHIRASAKRVLDAWQKPSLNSKAVKQWIRQVLGYFRNCYKGDGNEPECWNAGTLKIMPKNEANAWGVYPVLPSIDEHAGVHFIRQYYPEYVPTAKEFAEAKWGK